MSKAANLLTAMREAAGDAEHFTAGWIEASYSHTGLHDALHAVFRRQPTAQRLGLWLSENVGAQCGEYVLYGRHNSNAKAWRYSIRTPAEIEERKRQIEAAAEAKRKAAIEDQQRRDAARIEYEARRAAEREARQPPPPRMVVQVVQALADTTLNPYQPDPEPATESVRTLTTMRVDGTGRIVHTPVIGRDGMPVPAVPEAKAPEAKPDAVISRNLSMPPWIQEGRQATRAEWDEWQRDRAPVRLEAHEHVRNMTSDETGGYYNGVGGVTQPNGVYIAPVSDRRDGWRHGGPNWRQKL